MNCQISEKHRKELLRFLLLKTAAVRSGVKPGELLRVQHCYKSRNSEGFNFCLYRADILQTLKLNYLELRVEPESSLILFYHRETMAKTLSDTQNLSLLATLGYPAGCDMDDLLFFLRERFAARGWCVYRLSPERCKGVYGKTSADTGSSWRLDRFRRCLGIAGKNESLPESGGVCRKNIGCL